MKLKDANITDRSAAAIFATVCLGYMEVGQGIVLTFDNKKYCVGKLTDNDITIYEGVDPAIDDGKIINFKEFA